MTGREYGLVLAALKKGRPAHINVYKGPQYWVGISNNGKDDVCGDTPELALIAAAEAMGLSPVPVWTEAEIREVFRRGIRAELEEEYFASLFNEIEEEFFRGLSALHAKKGDATDN